MYLYVHIPFCKSKCSYCDFFSLPVGECSSVPDSYLAALLAEAAFRKQLHGVSEWNSVYVGGGTPGLLSAAQLRSFFSGLFSLCSPAREAEITLEVNCADIAEKNEKGFSAYLEQACDSGVNRISVGIQSLDDRVLNCVERRSSAADVIQALDNLKLWRKSGTQRQFSCDLIAGLPLSTLRTFKEGLLKVLSYEPDHISLYTLTLEKGTVLERRIAAGITSWNSDEADEQWLAGKTVLEEAGYVQYEVSNFAQKGFESRHNSAYWRMENYIGIGASAVGSVQNRRYTVTRNVEAYTAYWTTSPLIRRIPKNICAVEILRKEERITEFLMMGLRMLEGINAAEFYRRFSIPLEDIIGKVFTRWVKKGLAQRYVDNYRLNKKGILFLNDFLAEIIRERY